MQAFCTFSVRRRSPRTLRAPCPSHAHDVLTQHCIAQRAQARPSATSISATALHPSATVRQQHAAMRRAAAFARSARCSAPATPMRLRASELVAAPSHSHHYRPPSALQRPTGRGTTAPWPCARLAASLAAATAPLLPVPPDGACFAYHGCSGWVQGAAPAKRTRADEDEVLEWTGGAPRRLLAIRGAVGATKATA